MLRLYDVGKGRRGDAHQCCTIQILKCFWKTLSWMLPEEPRGKFSLSGRSDPSNVRWSGNSRRLPKSKQKTNRPTPRSGQLKIITTKPKSRNPAKCESLMHIMEVRWGGKRRKCHDTLSQEHMITFHNYIITQQRQRCLIRCRDLTILAQKATQLILYSLTYTVFRTIPWYWWYMFCQKKTQNARKVC